MATTTLQVHGLPGKPRAFTAKTPASTSGPHNPGHVTALGVHGLPGGLRSFTAKTPSVGDGPHNPGWITALSVMGVLGGRHSFLPKTEVVTPGGVAAPNSPRSKLHGWNKRRLLQWGGKFRN